MQEGALTWSLRRNSLPLPALQAQGPVRAHSFLALHFCIIFRDVFLYFFFMFFDGFRPPFWRHVGIIFHVFCITFSSIDSTRICHQFCKDFYIYFCQIGSNRKGPKGSNRDYGLRKYRLGCHICDLCYACSTAD